MTTKTYRGVVRGGRIVLEPDARLGEGTEVVVTPIAGMPGSSAAVIEAVDAAPSVPSAWVDELEQLIAEGRRPLAPPELFSDEPDARKGP